MTQTSDSPTASSPAQRRGFRRVLSGSMAGAVLEWYDFAAYGILAATVLGPLFFPGDEPVARLLLALATQGLGFVARPLGGIVFGHLGDRYGRKPVLVATFLTLGASTASIGLLPTYAQIGLWATALLVLLRLVQGFALGGEFGAAVLLVSEYGEPRRRGFWAAWPQAGGPLGTILATVVVAVLAAVLPAGSFDDWGWRIVFLLAVPLLVIGFLIRRGVEESPVFLAAQQRAASRDVDAAQQGRSSVVDALTSMPAQVLRGLGMRLGENVAFYVYTIFVLAYATTFIGFGRGTVVTAVAFGSVSQFIGMISGGALSDRLGRKPVMLGAAAVLGVWAPVFFFLVQQHSTPLLYLGICVGALAHGLLAGPEAAWIAELFPTRCRFAGASLVFQGSSIIAGAPAPFIAVWLIQHSGPGAVIAYLSVTVVITIVAVVTSRETKGVDLDAI